MPPPVGHAAPSKNTPPPAPAVPTAAIDVSNVDAKTLKALPESYRRSVAEAKTYADKHFSKMSPPPRVLVVPSPANGGEPVTVIVPPNAKRRSTCTRIITAIARVR